MKIRIIAEAGVNHNGDLALAKRLVDIAKKSGSDIVKFQTFKADRLVTLNAPKAKYQQVDNENESQFQMLEKLQISESMHLELLAYCNNVGIKFLSTPFDIESADFLSSIGQTLFKIPSGEITNYPYLRHVARIAGEVILSSGASTLNEIGSALDILYKNGQRPESVTVLHCTSAYPAPMNDVNLLAIKEIKNKFNINVGYSDHTLGIEIAIAAVALGATTIEKHFTLDHNLPGPDQKTSLEPNELIKMVESIRNIEIALGSGNKSPKQSEFENLNLIRKSIVAKSNIFAGEVFSNENLTTKRPGNGLSPMHWESVIGKIAIRNFEIDELIDLE
jgi:N,N'-diacetyllegionaminate synthase